MRLNKIIAPKFKISYDLALTYLKVTLLIIAAISVGINMYLSPAVGIKSLLIFVVAYFTAKLTEVIYYAFAKNQEYQVSMLTVDESFPEISGLIFAFLIPIGTPLFAVAISVAMAIVIVKLAFGGYSFNIFNIGVVAAIICYISWPSYMVYHLSSSYWIDSLLNTLSNDIFGNVLSMPAITSPASLLNANVLYPGYLFITHNTQAFLGFVPFIVILPLGLLLIFLKVVDYRIPMWISIFTIISGFIIGLSLNDMTMIDALYYGVSSLISTMLLFVAFFVASDPVTSPNTNKTIMVYSIIIVVVTMYIREAGSNIEGVLFAIIFANMFVPLLRTKSGIYSKNKSRIITAIIFLLLTIGGSYFVSINRNNVLNTYEKYDSSATTESVGEPAVDASSSPTT